MFEGIFQPMHLLLILLILLLIFGPGKLPQLGGSLGRTIKEFKQGVAEIGHSAEPKPEATTTSQTVSINPTTNSSNDAEYEVIERRVMRVGKPADTK